VTRTEATRTEVSQKASVTPKFSWFLPTGGDDERLGGASHGVGIGATGVVVADTGHREASLDYPRRSRRPSIGWVFTRF
jgi:hypothetical protein